MKKILFLLCLLSASLTSAFANTELSFSDATGLSGWGVDDQATDSQTQTMTFTGAWANWGWSLNNADYSGYDGYTAVTVTFTTNITTGYVYVGATYGDETFDSGAAYINKTEADDTEYTVTYTFDETKYSSMSNIYLSVCDLDFGGDGLPHKTGQVWDDSSNSMVDGEVVNATITIKSATLISKDMQPIVNINNEAYIQTYWPNQENWDEKVSDDSEETTKSGTITPTTGENLIPGAELTFDVAYGGLGWEYYTADTHLDLSGYSGVEVTYTVSTGTGEGDGNGNGEGGGNGNGEGGGEGNSDPGNDGPGQDSTETTDVSVYLDLVSGLPADEELQRESTEHSTSDISGSEGKITFTFPTEETDNNYIDKSDLTQIVIKASAACTVNITSIKLVSKTVATESTSFIVPDTSNAEDTKYYVNLNVTQTGTWAGDVNLNIGSDDSTDDNSGEVEDPDNSSTETEDSSTTPVTSAKITFKRAENLVGFQYEDTEDASAENNSTSTTTYLNLKSYTPASDEDDSQSGEGEVEGEEQSATVNFSQLEVSYTISSEAARQSDRIRVMLELMDKDYNNIEPYDNYCIGRIRVNLDDYSSSDIDFENIRNITFMLENIPDDDQPVLNIESIRLLTKEQVEAEKGQEQNLLISQLYTWQDIEGTKITPVSGSNDLQATIKTKTNWTAASWWVNNVSEDEYWGVELKVKANQHCVVRLSIENATAGDGTFVQCMSERGDEGSDDPSTVHTLILPFLKKAASEYNKNLSYTPANSNNNDTNTEGGDGTGDGNNGDNGDNGGYDPNGTALTAETEGTEGTDNSSTSDGSENLDGDVNEIYLLWGLIGDSSDTNVSDEATIEIVSAKLLSANAYSDDFLLIPINSDEGYGTYYNSSQNYRMPYGMKGTTITGVTEDQTSNDENNQESEDDESVDYTTYTITANWQYNPSSTDYNAGDIVPAGTPLLLLGSSDQDVRLLYTAFIDNSTTISDEIKNKSANNMLHGSDIKVTDEQMADTTALDNNDNGTTVDYYYYKLQYLEEEESGHGIGNIGFYWGASGGAAFAMRNYNHAWLALKQSDLSGTVGGVKISGFTGDDESENVDGDEGDDSGDTTTGIATVQAAISNGAIYNLQGVRVNDMNRKGIYIVDGKKIVKQ